MREKLKIEKIIHGGYGLARKDGFVYLIPYTAPGDLIVGDCKKVKDYFICELVEILEPSDIREKPKCFHFGYCGGCSFQHIKREEEIKIKKMALEEDLKRIGKIQKNVDEVIFLKRENYRNKVEYSFLDDRFAYFNSKNEKFIIKECFIEEENIKKFREKGIFKNLEKLILRTDSSGKIIAIGVDDNFRRFIIKGKNEKLIYRFNEFEFEVSPYSFFQTNTGIAEKMIEKLNELINPSKEDVIVDGFGGVGTFGISISKKVKNVSIIEKSENEIIDAGNNILRNKCENVKPINIDINKAEDYIEKANKIILDPPREGINKNLIDIINRTKLEMIVYISCNPATLSRDLNLIKDYRIEKLILFDMFPMSYHTEAMVKLKYAPGGT